VRRALGGRSLEKRKTGRGKLHSAADRRRRSLIKAVRTGCFGLAIAGDRAVFSPQASDKPIQNRDWRPVETFRERGSHIRYKKPFIINVMINLPLKIYQQKYQRIACWSYLAAPIVRIHTSAKPAGDRDLRSASLRRVTRNSRSKRPTSSLLYSPP